MGTLADSEVYQLKSSSTKHYYISTSSPVIVAQLAESYQLELGHQNTDPFIVQIQALDNPANLHSEYRFVTMRTTSSQTFVNRLNVVMETPGTTNLRLDGAPVSTTWKVVATSGYSAATVDVSNGSHVIADVTGKPFAVFLYGQKYRESYALDLQRWPLDDILTTADPTSTGNPTTAAPTTTNIHSTESPACFVNSQYYINAHQNNRLSVVQTICFKSRGAIACASLCQRNPDQCLTWQFSKLSNACCFNEPEEDTASVIPEHGTGVWFPLILC